MSEFVIDVGLFVVLVCLWLIIFCSVLLIWLQINCFSLEKLNIFLLILLIYSKIYVTRKSSGLGSCLTLSCFLSGCELYPMWQKDSWMQFRWLQLFCYSSGTSSAKKRSRAITNTDEPTVCKKRRLTGLEAHKLLMVNVYVTFEFKYQRKYWIWIPSYSVGISMMTCILSSIGHPHNHQNWQIGTNWLIVCWHAIKYQSISLLTYNK